LDLGGDFCQHCSPAIFVVPLQIGRWRFLFIALKILRHRGPAGLREQKADTAPQALIDGLGAGGNNGPGLGRPTKRAAQYFLQSPHQGTLCCAAHSVSSKSDQVIWI
jgi:hypothetical protein